MLMEISLLVNNISVEKIIWSTFFVKSLCKVSELQCSLPSGGLCVILVGILVILLIVGVRAKYTPSLLDFGVDVRSEVQHQIQRRLS